MVQVAAALLFTLAAGLGVTVILAMLKNNENAILSALLGEGAFPVDAARAAAGKAVFDAHCATCHASERTGTRLPLADVGTDRSRLDTWSRDAAIKANRNA